MRHTGKKPVIDYIEHAIYAISRDMLKIKKGVRIIDGINDSKKLFNIKMQLKNCRDDYNRSREKKI